MSARDLHKMGHLHQHAQLIRQPREKCTWDKLQQVEKKPQVWAGESKPDEAESALLT